MLTSHKTVTARARLVVLSSLLVGTTLAADPYNCTTQPASAFVPIVLTNSRNVSLSIIPYGATLTNLMVPDNKGILRDIILGYDNKTLYCAGATHNYFGASIGRIANRIAKGQFTLEGKTYHTPINEQTSEGGDTLHGGNVGYDRRLWTVVSANSSVAIFSLFSPDGEMGFPGDLNITVVWTLTEPEAAGTLGTWKLDYHATTAATTVIAMTNHAYFNLNANIGDVGTVLDHQLTMPANSNFIEVDKALIPTGNIVSVGGTALDFRQRKTIGKDIKNGTVSPTGGYDNAWLMDGWKPQGPVVQQGTMFSPLTGIGLYFYSDQAGVQVYSGNGLDGVSIPRKASQCASGRCFYQKWGAATLEMQGYIGAVNQPKFPSAELRPGEVYEQHTAYVFYVEGSGSETL